MGIMKDSTPKISVIIPVYNAQKYIEKCARALFGQTFAPVEYIFIDDCSTDASIETVRSVLDDFPERKDACVFISHKENMGPSAARNTGLSRASGEFVMFCDSDDWMEPEMMEKLYRAAESSSADIAVCDFYMVTQNSRQVCRAVTWTSDRTASMRNYLEYVWNVLWNLLVRRELFVRHGIRFPEDCMYCEDFNVTVRLFDAAGVTVNVHEPLYNYNRSNEASVVHNMDRRTMMDEQRMYLDIIGMFRRNGRYPDYERQLCWRVLKSKQELVLDESTYSDFVSLYPESNAYILSCPYLNVKLKIMMWCLVHNMGIISRLMLSVRRLRMKIAG